MLRRAMLRRVPAGERSLARSADHRRGAAVFDGRLLIAAVELASGRRVIFGAPGAPNATVAQAVLASCAIPGVFAPVRIGARDYVDGGAWSPTNMDALALERGERVLCLNPTGSLRPDARRPRRRDWTDLPAAASARRWPCVIAAPSVRTSTPTRRARRRWGSI